jgi:DegV family protein with EDD domain
VAERAKVRVVPMWLTLGGEAVRDGTLSLEEVTSRLDEGLTTSGPNPGEVAELVSQADEGDGVIVLTLSQRMSGTYDAARLGISLTDRRVALVDTGTAAGAEGLVVLAAARAAAAGADLETVEAAARAAAGAVRLVATLPTLDHLARGGRVPGAAAWAGRWLGLNPLFEFRGGHVRPLRPALNRHAAQERILSSWGHSLRPDADLHVAAMHALDPASAEHLLDEVSRQVKPASAFVGPFSPVMVAHTGPGLVGLAWWWEPRPAQP